MSQHWTPRVYGSEHEVPWLPEGPPVYEQRSLLKDLLQLCCEQWVGLSCLEIVCGESEGSCGQDAHLALAG